MFDCGVFFFRIGIEIRFRLSGFSVLACGSGFFFVRGRFFHRDVSIDLLFLEWHMRTYRSCFVSSTMGTVIFNLKSQDLIHREDHCFII